MSTLEYDGGMSLRHAALGLLTMGPASGYDLLQTFHGSLANVWPATQSQLYGELGKLADAGLVTVTEEGARRRKEYALTEAGLAELRHWMTDIEPSVIRRSDLLLRVFFLGVIDYDQGLDFLRKREEAAVEYEAGLRATEEAIAPETADLAVYGRIALEWGLRFTEMQREWAVWAQEELTKAKKA
jgi:DNA-binding PadR family transcriptional regulator